MDIIDFSFIRTRQKVRTLLVSAWSNFLLDVKLHFNHIIVNIETGELIL